MTRIDFGSRKLQKLNTSFFVVLPKIWTNNMNLKKGDCVFMEMASNGNLIVKKKE